MNYGIFNDKSNVLNQYLTFRLNSQLFCIGIETVREINQMVDIVPIPQTPEFIIGVMNLRGKIIPVIDLRAKFGLGSLERSKESCVIIIDCEVGLIGIAIEAVQDVITLSESQIEIPEALDHNKLNYIKGLGKIESKIFVIIDIVNTLSKAEFYQIQNLPLEQ